MRTSLRKRFWLEAALATITSILFVITLFWKDWIEIVFGVDPDLGNGLLEWSIVGTLLVVTIVLLVLTCKCFDPMAHGHSWGIPLAC